VGRTFGAWNALRCLGELVLLKFVLQKRDIQLHAVKDPHHADDTVGFTDCTEPLCDAFNAFTVLKGQTKQGSVQEHVHVTWAWLH
jgi:hypothetical protein